MIRIGNGYDVHRLSSGYKLIIGGVLIPFEKGLEGHSDADVLIHAIIDAILGALALSDIGSIFPDTDDTYKGADSVRLLKEAAAIMCKKGYEIGNVDTVVIAQKPKLAPYIGSMRENIANAIDTSISNVSVKATTEEWLGFTGAGEGIAAHAVVCVRRKEYHKIENL